MLDSLLLRVVISRQLYLHLSYQFSCKKKKKLAVLPDLYIILGKSATRFTRFLKNITKNKHSFFFTIRKRANLEQRDLAFLSSPRRVRNRVSKFFFFSPTRPRVTISLYYSKERERDREHTRLVFGPFCNGHTSNTQPV